MELQLPVAWRYGLIQVVILARFKEAVKPMDKTSEAIFGLKPVIFHYKAELDPNSIQQFGLVAEQVELSITGCGLVPSLSRLSLHSKISPDLAAKARLGAEC